MVIQTYGLSLILSFITVVFLSSLSAKKWGVEPLTVIDAFLWGFIGAFIGARLWFVFEHIRNFIFTPIDILKFWKGGFSSSGGIIGMCVVFLLYFKNLKEFLSFTDLISPYFGIGFAIQKFFGCLMAGCCYGKPTKLPWSISFTNPFSLVPAELIGVPLHPAQIYDGLVGIISFLLLLSLREKLTSFNSGTTTFLFLILFSAGRFITSFFRGDMKPLLYTLNISGVEYGLLIIFSCILFAYNLYRKGR